MRILLTGFEPFEGRQNNPSQEVVQQLANCPPEGFELYTAILPVEHVRGPQELLQALDRCQPEAVVCLGEAGGRAGLSLERAALNLIDDAIADNAGEQWTDRPVAEGGPAAYFTTLSIRAMQQAMLESGVPAELSLSAGTFLCNQIFYTLLHSLSQRQKLDAIPAGFIHLPRLPGQAAAAILSAPQTSSQATMSLNEQVRGLTAGLKVLVK